MQAIADRKKSQNIGEYLVYMYQMEDLIRSYQGNMEEIGQYVVSHYPVSEAEKERIKTWFAGLAASMKQQELMQKGHLLELQDLVQQLLELHYQLLKTDANYVATFHSAKAHLLEAVKAAQTEEIGNEIQICLNGKVARTTIDFILLCHIHAEVFVVTTAGEEGLVAVVEGDLPVPAHQ